ncbi:MAG: PAS domain S-box protein [candidate division KSB1 bacterium]|nr:PAS domain S-box protein [candidate division KSB1 bacterium]
MSKILETAGALIIVMDKEGRIEQFNKACEKLTGFTIDDVKGKRLIDLPFMSEAAKLEFLKHCSDIVDNQPYTCENIWKSADGKDRIITWTSSYIPNKSGDILYIICSGIDITAHKATESALLSEKERLSVTLKSIGEGVISIDAGGKIILMNEVAEELTGWDRDSAIGKALEDVLQIVRDDDISTSSSDQTNGQRTFPELHNHRRLMRRDGTQLLIDYGSAPIYSNEGEEVGVVVVFRDISERKRIEEELQKADKLNSIGMLAGGIAHDFNNILTVIIGNISLVKLALNTEHGALTKIQNIEKVSMQAKELTQRLLTFSKGDTQVQKIVALSNVLQESVSFGLTGSNVNCDLDVSEDLWFLKMDPGQIAQMFNNLIINASQAMPDGGTIRIRAENAIIEKGSAMPLPPGPYVKVSVTDEGIGIPNDSLSKIFDPFYTTKKKGSGLGLSICHSIVQNHRGHISVESTVGKGTVFRVLLPAQTETDHFHEDDRDTVIAGKGKILVMDDEELVRIVAAEMLTQLGYDPGFAGDGREAIEKYKRAKRAGAPYDAVILDLTVPGGMGGRETLVQLMEIDPDINAIVSSGYAAEPIIAELREQGFIDFIEKPYEIGDLSEVLHRTLSADAKQA